MSTKSHEHFDQEEEGVESHELMHESDRHAYIWFKYKRYPYLLAKFAFWGAILVIVAYLLRMIEPVLFPIAVSLVIAYLLDPLVEWFERKGISRTIGILIVILSMLGVATLFSLVLYPTFSKTISMLGQRLPQLDDQLFAKLSPWVERTFGFKIPDSISATIKEYREQIDMQIPVLIRRASSAITDILTQSQAIVTSLVNMVMIPVFSFYFLRDFEGIRRRVLSLVPIHNHDPIMSRLDRMDTVVGAWFRGQLTVSAILALLYSVGLGVVFGVSGIGVVSGIGIGILTGFLNIIPYFGVMTGAITSILMVAIDWSGIWPLIGVACVFGVVQLLEGYYITPKIVGNAVGLSPVAVIIVLLIGGSAFGLTGILIATPIAGIIKVLLPDIMEYYRRSTFYTGTYMASYRRHLTTTKRVTTTDAGEVLVQQEELEEEGEVIEDGEPMKVSVGQGGSIDADDKPTSTE